MTQKPSHNFLCFWGSSWGLLQGTVWFMLPQGLPYPDEASEAQRGSAMSSVSHSSLGFSSGSRKSHAGDGGRELAPCTLSATN